MRVAGLGKIHKEIEEQKREEGRASDRRRQRALSVGLLGQHQMTRVPSRSVRHNQRFTNGPSPSSRGNFRVTHGPTPFPRVHCKDISREVLDQNNLAWDWDPDDEDYIVIKKHMTRQELKELVQHSAWLRERREREIALREAELQAEQAPKLRESEGRSDARRRPERRHERDNERASTRGDRYADGLQSGPNFHRDQTQNNHPPAPREVSTARPIEELPLPSHPRSQRSRAPSVHSRLDQPFSPPDYTYMERPSQPPPQAHIPRSHSGRSQAPAELPRIPSRQAQDSYHPGRRASSVMQGSTPFARAPSIGPTSRKLNYVQAPPDNVRFETRSHRSESLAGATIRNERPRQAAENARQFLRQQTSGSAHPRRPDFVNGPESRQAYGPTPGWRPEGRDGMERRNSVRGYRAF